MRVDGCSSRIELPAKSGVSFCWITKESEREKMKKRTQFKRLVAILLCAGVLVSNVPYVVLPAIATEQVETQGVGGSDAIDTVTTIDAFDALEDNETAVTVALGTKEEDLNLPSKLTALSGAVEVSVTWSSGKTDEQGQQAEPSYSPDIAGSYIFTATGAAPEGYVFAEGITWPTVTVTVEPQAQEQHVITALSSAQSISVPQGTAQEDLGLPQVLVGQYEGGSVDIAVSWTCLGYDPETPQEYTFTASATVAEGYIFAEDLVWPTVQVEVQASNQVALLNTVAHGQLTDTISYTITEYTDADGTAYHVLDMEGTGKIPDYTSTTYKNTPWYPYRTTLREINIGEGIDAIGNYAFSSCNMNQVNISKTVTSLGRSCFGGCKALESLAFPEDSQLQTIGNSAFSGCDALTTVVLPASLETMESDVFNSDKNLVSVDFSNCTKLTSLGMSIFYECSKLEELDLSACVELTEIPDNLAMYASGLKKVDLPPAVTKIGEDAFYRCTSLSGIQFPETLRTIYEQAFYQCYSLKELRIPASLSTIWDHAFDSCSGLTNVDFSEAKNLYNVLEGAFSRCSKLTELDLSGCTSLTRIQRYVFSDCDALEKVIFPSGLEVIEDSAFAWCYALRELDLTTCPKLYSIGERVFASCDQISKISAYAGDERSTDRLLSVLESTPVSSKELVLYPKNHQIYLSAEFLQTIKEGGHKLSFGETQVSFTKDPDAASQAGVAPLNRLEGEAYIDSQGVIYLLGEDGEASLAYVPQNLIEYTVPQSITLEGNQVWPVTGVASNALGMAYDLTKLTFEDASKVELADMALAGCATLVEVNELSDISAIKKIFLKVGTAAFWGTGLKGADDSQRVSCDSTIEVTAQDVVASLEATVADPCRDEGTLRITGTGNYANLTVKLSGSQNGDYHYRLYLFSPGGAISLAGLEMTEDKIYEDGTASYCLKRVQEMPGLYYVEIKLDKAGSTWEKPIILGYDAGTVGGYLMAWLEMAPVTGSFPGSMLPPESYYEIYWETAEVPYSLGLTSTPETFSYIRDDIGEPVEFTKVLSWTLKDNSDPREHYGTQVSYAKDPVQKVEHEFVLQLPEGLTWNSSILAGLQQGVGEVELEVNGLVLKIGGETIFECSSLTNNTKINKATAELLEGNKVRVKMWQVASNAYSMSGDPKITMKLPLGAVIVENEDTYDYRTPVTITLEAKSLVTYTYHQSRQTEQKTVTWTSTPPYDQLNFYKMGGAFGSYYSDGSSYILKVTNSTVMHLPLVSIQDTLDNQLLICPDALETLFLKETEGTERADNKRLAQYLTVTINNARLYQYDSETGALGMVTLTDGSTQHMLTADRTDEYETQFTTGTVVITLAEDGESLSIKINDQEAEVVPADRVEEYLLQKGFAVINSTTYDLKWDFGSDYKVISGDEYELDIPASIKDSFQQLTTDHPTYRGASTTSPASNYLKTSYRVNNTAYFKDSSGTKIDTAIESYNLDCAIENTTEKTDLVDGQVITYTTNIHQARYSQRLVGLPVVGVASGAQCVLAPVEKNKDRPWVSETNPEIYTDTDGTEYYRLALPEACFEQGRYIYQGVWLGEYYADTVTVIRYDKLTESEKTKYQHPEYTNIDTAIVPDGYVTEMRMYLTPKGESYGSSVRTITYKSCVDASLSVDENPEEYWINNMMYLNDRKNDRLFTCTGKFPVRTTTGNKEQLDEQGNVLTQVSSGITEGQTAHYRLSIQNETRMRRTIASSAVWDALPQTFGVFQWDNSNVKIRYGYSDGTEYADIESEIQTKNAGAGIYEIHWPNGIEVNGKSTLYIYVDLQFPSDTETEGGSSEWSQYCEVIGNQTVANSFHLIGETYTILHAIAQPTQAYLQKGVQQIQYKKYQTSLGTDIKNLGIYYEAGKNGTGDNLQNYVNYYVLLYNQGPGYLYLTQIQDTLGNSSVKLMKRADAYSWFTGLPNDVEFLEVAISYSGSSQTSGFGSYSFSPSYNESNMDTIIYDDAAGAYYLKPNQAIAFTYTVAIGGSKDFYKNVVGMPIYDPYQVGVSMATDVNVQGNVGSEKQGNDGACEWWTNEEAAEQGDFSYTAHPVKNWLSSSVTIRKGEVVPGLTKEVVRKRNDISGADNPYNGFAGAKESLQWKVTVENMGENIIRDYTITDTLPQNYSLTTGDVRVSTPTISDSLLFTVTSVTEDGNGKLQRIGIKTDNNKPEETVRVSQAYTYRALSKGFTLRLFYNEYEQLVMELVLTNDSEFRGFSIQPEEALTVTYWSKNYTTKVPLTVYTNTVVLSEYEQEMDLELVTKGVILRDEDGEPVGIQAKVNAIIAEGYATVSEKKVQEEGNAENTATSSSGTPISISQTADGYSNFTYNLVVDNSAAEDNAIKWITLIDNLPQPGDTTTFNQHILRNSEFMVSFADHVDVSVWYEKDGKRTELPQASIAYSEKVAFSDLDWGTVQNPPSSEGWSNSLTPGARSIRITLREENDGEGIIPAGAKLYVTFTCKADSNAELGAVAWNSFGYRYQMVSSNSALEAAPMEVGIKIPDYPEIKKTLTDPDGIEEAAVYAQTFQFVVYQGQALNGEYATGQELLEALSTENRIFTVQNIQIDAGDSTGREKLYDLMQYTYDAQKGELTKTQTPWVWTANTAYTVVELGQTLQKPLGSYGDYEFYTLNKENSNSYTFTYIAGRSQLISAENARVERTLTIQKVEEGNPTAVLANAVFGLYSPSEQENLSEEEVRAKGSSIGLSSNQQDKVVADMMTVIVGDTTYYLCDLGKTNYQGIVTWQYLTYRTYCYKELWAPSGYQIQGDGTKVVTFEQNGDCVREIIETVSNKKAYFLPITGGVGRWQIPVMGVALCTLAVLGLTWKRRKQKS